MAIENTSPSLIARLRDSTDVDAWTEFDLRYRDLILRHCRRRGLQTADAEDVRQLVLLSLSRAMRSFRYDPALGRFRDYLGRVVRNAIQRHLSRPARASEAPDLDVDALDFLAGGPAEPLAEQWELDWMHHHMRLAMQEVERSFEPESLAIFERLVSGESVLDVTRGCGKSPEAVHKIMQRIRDRLSELVARQIRAEDFPQG